MSVRFSVKTPTRREELEAKVMARKAQLESATPKTSILISTSSSTTTSAAATTTNATTASSSSTSTNTINTKPAAATTTTTPTHTPTGIEASTPSTISKDNTPPGKYVNWGSQHGTLAAQPWCCIGDLMAFCDRYEYKSLSRADTRTHAAIVTEVQTLLAGRAPFDMRQRFPGAIRSPENLWVCIGRCPGVEYHLNRILSVFRKPLDKLSSDKQRQCRQNFHLAINELRLDISARISEVRLYDRLVFEKDFHLNWQETME